LRKIALIAFPPLRVGQASVQNSATATFLQGTQFIQQEKKINPKIFPCHFSVTNTHSYCHHKTGINQLCFIKKLCCAGSENFENRSWGISAQCIWSSMSMIKRMLQIRLQAKLPSISFFIYFLFH
jgi:hypothetical protein